MSEELTKDLNGGSTNVLPFEIVVTQQLAKIVSQLEQLETRLRAEMSEGFAQVDGRFAQVHAELRQLSALSEQVNERITDLDYKVDSFIREQLNMKREITKLQKPPASNRALCALSRWTQPSLARTLAMDVR